MPELDFVEKSQEERDKNIVDMIALGVAYKEYLNMPVIVDIAMREQPEHLRDYFRERLDYHRKECLKASESYKGVLN